MTWFFVDDAPAEAQAFADQLADGRYAIDVKVIDPGQARARLLSNKEAPAGVLMDVELGNAAGELGSGPGIAQDIRVKQRSKDITAEYPIVRFAGRAKVERSVKGDPGSDDLFDLKIPKEELAKDVAAVQIRLIGLENVYSGLNAVDTKANDAINRLLALDEALLRRWSNDSFHDRLLSALQIATHVGAGAFLRGFLTPTGLLIGENVLSYRLGVDAAKSGEYWTSLVSALPFQYKGTASEFFPRWWARGLEEWWLETVKGERPLGSLSIAQRIDTLSKQFNGLVPMSMPEGSAGDKPWRLCALSLEEDPPVLIPVDPSEAVRLTPRADPPPWTDPTHVSLRLALQKRDDLRLNRADLERLQRKYRVK